MKDEALIKVWLHGRPATTAAAYRRDIAGLVAHVGKPLADMTLPDLQSWADADTGRVSSRARRIAAVRSFYRFAVATELVERDPSRQLRAPKVDRVGAERMLTEKQVARMLALETDPRRHAAIRLFYLTALRVSEVASLSWGDMRSAGAAGGKAHVVGKGSKPRSVEIPPGLWRELADLTPDRRNDSPVIPSRSGRRINRRALLRIVSRAAKRIGLTGVSPHWMRHSAISHAIHNGASLATTSKWAGHANLTTTSVYVHAKPGESAASHLAGGSE